MTSATFLALENRKCINWITLKPINVEAALLLSMQKTDYNCSQRLRDSFYGLFQLTVFFPPFAFFLSMAQRKLRLVRINITNTFNCRSKQMIEHVISTHSENDLRYKLARKLNLVFKSFKRIFVRYNTHKICYSVHKFVQTCCNTARIFFNVLMRHSAIDTD